LNTTGSGNTYDNTLLFNGNKLVTTGGTKLYITTSGRFSPITGTTSTTATYLIFAESTSGEISTGSATITWSNKNYCFGSSNLYTNNNISILMTTNSGTLATSKTLDITKTLNGEFFYYAYPKAYGVPTFTINGLSNNAWGSLSNNTLFSMNFINSNSYNNQYYVARSDNKLTGTFSIKVS
jgi:hypothetical protein